MTAIRWRALAGAACLAAASGGATAQIEYVDLTGEMTVDARWFPDTGLYPGQTSTAGGFALAPRLYLETARGWSFNATPFLRYDNVDAQRSHADLRQAYFLMFGDIGDDQWEMRLGVDQVFWGVAESQRLVDIVNQVDLVEHPSAGEKLGQPMVHFTRFGDWGTAEFLVLPYHRPRTFPGPDGRMRLSLPVAEEPVSYEASNAERNVDLAARYSHSFGSLDLGLSVFDGTSRDPSMAPGLDAAAAPVLLQHYAKIRQWGLDAQVTTGAWLLKLEAIHRSGEPNLRGVRQDYSAAVMGFEYQFSSIFGGAADLALISEWNHDARGADALPRRNPITLENDLVAAARIGFNDVSGSELSFGLVGDLERSTRFASLEFSRRLNDRWSISLETYALLEVDPADIYHQARQDSFIELGLNLFF